MQFLGDSIDQAQDAIVHQIHNLLLDGDKVLWLVSGGSCVDSQVAVMNILREKYGDKLVNLTVLPVDERYGEAGHHDSNTQQMRVAGFDPGDARWIDVLASNLPLSETVTEYSHIAEEAFAWSTQIVATLGIGNDGHTAGLLPSSPAITDTVSTVVGYEWSDYTRMTLGVSELLQIDAAYVLAYGESKQEALTRLQKNQEEFSELPAKILYDIPEVYVYNDTISRTEDAA